MGNKEVVEVETVEMKKYQEQKSGEWIQPIKKNYGFCCCDCGLIHRIDYRIITGRVQFRVFRNNRATGQYRRFNKIKIKYIDKEKI